MRKNKTKMELATALKALMTTKSLDKITIREITDYAYLNRQSFYYHFEDIYDLLRWTLSQEVITLIQDYEDEEIWREGLLDMLRYLKENESFVLNILHSLGYTHFKRYFYGEVNAVISNFIEKRIIDLDYDKDFKDFVAHFYTVAFTGLAISWIEGEMEETAEEVVEKINLMLTHQLTGLYLLNQQAKGEVFE